MRTPRRIVIAFLLVAMSAALFSVAARSEIHTYGGSDRVKRVEVIEVYWDWRWIAFAGGKVRHEEFRKERPLKARSQTSFSNLS